MHSEKKATLLIAELWEELVLIKASIFKSIALADRLLLTIDSL